MKSPSCTRLYAWLALAALLLLLPACGASQSGAAPTQATALPSSRQIKFGLLGIMDTLPVHVAEVDGLFQAKGVAVEIQIFSSAIARDAAMQAGALDGELNDVVSTAILNKNGPTVQIVRTAMATNETRPVFQMLTSPKNGVATPAALKGKKLAISNNTVIDWVTDQLLLRAGLKASDVQRENVVEMPLRMQMLSQGQVDAATLPEPLASQAIGNGAKPIIVDSGSGLGATSCLVFARRALGDKPEAVRRFLAAYEEATTKINASFDNYRELMVQRKLLNPALKDTFKAMPFPKSQVPSCAELARYSDWLVGRGVIAAPLNYESTVDGGYLPK